VTIRRSNGVALLAALSLAAMSGCVDAGSDGASRDSASQSTATARDPPDLEQLYGLLRVSEYDSHFEAPRLKREIGCCCPTIFVNGNI